MLDIFEKDTSLCIWVCECRNSDQIMVLLGSEENRDINNNFDDITYDNAKYFSSDDYDSAIDYVYKYIRYIFKNQMHINKHYKFETYKSIDDIKKLQNGEDIHDIKVYYALASYCDINEKYSCDLAFKDNKLGIKFQNLDNYYVSDFIECDINLTDEVSLMIDMKQRLDKFIADELAYYIEMNGVIKSQNINI